MMAALGVADQAAKASLYDALAARPHHLPPTTRRAAPTDVLRHVLASAGADKSATLTTTEE